MSFGDLMLLLLCVFVILTVIDQGTSRLAANSPPEASSVPAVGSVQTDWPPTEPLEWPPSRNVPFDLEVHPATRRDVELETDDQIHSRISAGRRGDAPPAETAPAEVVLAKSVQIPAERKVEDALREIFRSAGDRVEIQALPGAVTVRLRDTITFRSGSAELLPEVRPLLEQVALLLFERPDIRVETAGHTDEVPIATAIYPSNWELSAARAAAVARYLLTQAGIDPQRIQIAGYGEHRPVDSRPTVEGRARNRRVEIRFVHPLPTPPDTSGSGKGRKQFM